MIKVLLIKSWLKERIFIRTTCIAATSMARKRAQDDRLFIPCNNLTHLEINSLCNTCFFYAHLFMLNCAKLNCSIVTTLLDMRSCVISHCANRNCSNRNCSKSLCPMPHHLHNIDRTNNIACHKEKNLCTQFCYWYDLKLIGIH